MKIDGIRCLRLIYVAWNADLFVNKCHLMPANIQKVLCYRQKIIDFYRNRKNIKRMFLKVFFVFMKRNQLTIVKGQ